MMAPRGPKHVVAYYLSKIVCFTDANPPLIIPHHSGMHKFQPEADLLFDLVPNVSKRGAISPRLLNS